jgi:hypothetical protein
LVDPEVSRYIFDVLVMGFRIEPELKKFFQKMADEEYRSLSNFMINAVLTYIKEHKGVTWEKPEK